MNVDKTLDKIIRDCGKYKNVVKKTMALPVALPEGLSQYDPVTKVVAVADGIIESAKAAKKRGVVDTKENKEFLDGIVAIIRVSAAVMKKHDAVVVE